MSTPNELPAYRPPRHRTGVWIACALLAVVVAGTGLGVLLISSNGGKDRAEPAFITSGPPVVVMSHSSSVPPAAPAVASATQPTPRPTITAKPPPKPKPAPKPPPVLHVGLVSIKRSAAGGPATAAAAVLNSYFAGINAHNFRPIARALDPHSRFGPDTRAFARSIVRGSWTTHDTGIFVTRVAVGSGGSRLSAHVTFRSTQSRAEHPPHSGTCSLWSVTYTLTRRGSAYLISDSRSIDRPC